MKCRRSKNSRGARLRSDSATAVRQPPARPPNPSGAPSPDLVTSVLTIDTHTDGSINYAGTVRVAAQGSFSGEIRAQIIAVEGQIAGNLYADEAIRLAATARVHG